MKCKKKYLQWERFVTAKLFLCYQEPESSLLETHAFVLGQMQFGQAPVFL